MYNAFIAIEQYINQVVKKGHRPHQSPQAKAQNYLNDSPGPLQASA
jgi:hypothetical protein